MAMMPSAATSSNPYDSDAVERDLIDPDDGALHAAACSSRHVATSADNQLATLDDLDDPLQGTSDRAPLTGNIQRPAANTQSYLTSSIPGEDRRAPTNTIDETVWETLSRDIFAIWEKMKQVLYPKYLLGGVMQRGGGIGAAERGEASGFGGGLRDIAGRWPDADAILQGGMSEGLRDWDLWGPLIFCLLLSLFLSWGARGSQKDLVFSGVFAMVWIGEAVVTLQIKLLGGNMCVDSVHLPRTYVNPHQRLLPVRLHHRLHPLPARHCLAPQRPRHTWTCPSTGLSRPHSVVIGSRRKHHGWFRRGQEPCGHCSIPAVCLLCCAGLSLFRQLERSFAWACKSSFDMAVASYMIPGVSGKSFVSMVMATVQLTLEHEPCMLRRQKTMRSVSDRVSIHDVICRCPLQQLLPAPMMLC